MTKFTFRFKCQGTEKSIFSPKGRQFYKSKIRKSGYTIFLLTGLRIYTGEYKAQGPTLCPTLCPTEGRALRGPRALYSPV